MGDPLEAVENEAAGKYGALARMPASWQAALRHSFRQTTPVPAKADLTGRRKCGTL